MATKVDQDESFDNCLWSNGVMEFGKHRISLKLMKGEGIGLAHLFGLVRDGAAWNKFHGEKEGQWSIRLGPGLRPNILIIYR